MEETLQVVIPSRKRSGMVHKAMALFRNPLVCVDEAEADEYRKVVPEKQLWLHPSSVNTLQTIRQWMLDHSRADVIFQCDDDVHSIFALPGHKVRRITDVDAVEDILWNAALNSRDAGTVMFWFAHTPNPIQCDSCKPFRLVSQPVGCAMGIWRKPFNKQIRFDPDIQHAGLDAAMRCLYHYRIVWCDSRFSFLPGPHMTAEGGLSGVRTAEGILQDDELLMRRYGKALTIRHDKRTEWKPGVATVHVRLRVDR